jgi:murein DD-endopeptidase MepM/ murein hydrolase activator NlpD|tara:strand:+ start:370 stop:1188 length:819 start_codon:yes stop_codon:yes gene_type:complete
MVVGQLNKILILILVIISSSHNLYAVEFKGKFEQGSFVLGKTNPGSNVEVDHKKVRVSKDGYFAFGLGRDRKKDIVIKIIKDGKSEIFEKKVYRRKYEIQRIDGLPKKQVTPPKEVYDRIKKDNILIGKAREVDSSLDHFKNKFIKPVDNAIITGVYGSQRILNGKPRRPHFGLDYAADEGTPIKAMMNGVVTLAEKNLYFTGGTIIFDHGHGISTLYMHMKDVGVKKGQAVKQGEIIGTVGKTGRSTGPHLDIRLNWFNVKLDPASILELN